MGVVLEKSHAYVFIGGMCVGSFSNVFSNIVISGLLLYIVTPEIFTEKRIERIKNYTWNWVSPSNDEKTENDENKKNKEVEKPTNSFFPKITFDISSLPSIPTFGSQQKVEILN